MGALARSAGSERASDRGSPSGDAVGKEDVMIQGIYVVTHGGIVPGREQFVSDLFKSFGEFWGGQKDAKPVGTYFLMPGSGSRDHMAFMSIYSGKLKDLHAIITSERYERLWAVTAQVTKNLSGRLYGTGDRDMINRVMAGAKEEWGNKGFPKA
jgi:hypothetical protein